VITTQPGCSNGKRRKTDSRVIRSPKAPERKGNPIRKEKIAAAGVNRETARDQGKQRSVMVDNLDRVRGARTKEAEPSFLKPVSFLRRKGERFLGKVGVYVYLCFWQGLENLVVGEENHHTNEE